MAEEILNLMEERKLMKNRDNDKLRRKFIEAKERRFDRACRDMEDRMHTNPNKIYHQVKKPLGRLSI